MFCKQQLRRNRKAACEHTHTAGLAGLPRMRPEPVADPTGKNLSGKQEGRTIVWTYLPFLPSKHLAPACVTSDSNLPWDYRRKISIWDWKGGIVVVVVGQLLLH